MDAHDILGDSGEERFTGRRVHYVDIGWGDAAKHRQVVAADTGLVVRITLPRGAFLRDGAVIADDGTDVVAVRRPAEDAIVVPLGENSARRMLLFGYLLGNQHAPVDVSDGVVAAPLFTSAGAALELLADLGIAGEIRKLPLAAHGWSRTSSDSHAGHHH